MHAIANSRCQSSVLFSMNVYVEGRGGTDMESRFGWLLDCCSRQEALQMQHRGKKND